MKPIRLIVSDVDGTLLSESHRLTPRVCEAVEQFQKEGGWFTFATGRPLLTVKSLAKELNIQIPFICCNGSVLADQQQILNVDHLAINELDELIQEADRQGVTVLVFREHQIDALRRTEKVDRFEVKENIVCHIAGSSKLLPKQDIHKLLLIGDMEVIKPLWSAFASASQKRFAAFQSEIDFLEVIPGNQSKGTAMLELMRHLNLTSDEVMAVGNQMNDLDMLELAGIGVAVGNSVDELKAHADYICESGYGDGVVEAMLKFTSIGSKNQKIIGI